MITFHEAQARLFALAPRLAVERLAIGQAAGRVISENVLSPGDLPPFSYSAMDGYAVRTADFAALKKGAKRVIITRRRLIAPPACRPTA